MGYSDEENGNYYNNFSEPDFEDPNQFISNYFDEYNGNIHDDFEDYSEHIDPTYVAHMGYSDEENGNSYSNFSEPDFEDPNQFIPDYDDEYNGHIHDDF